MKCVVWNCNNERNNKVSKISFFSFPKEKNLLNMWVKFCKQKKPFNPNTWRICMEHFDEEFLKKNLQVEMGFGTKRFLKPGAIPSLYKNIKPVAQLRQKRLQRRNNKKMVASLLQESSLPIAQIVPDAFTAPSVSIESEPSKESCVFQIEECLIEEDALMEIKYSETDIFAATDLEQPHFDNKENNSFVSKRRQLNPLETQVKMLQKQVKSLKRDNIYLRRRLWKSQQKHLHDIKVLKDTLQKTELQRNNMEQKLRESFTEIFTSANVEEDDTPDLGRLHNSLTGVILNRLCGSQTTADHEVELLELDSMPYDGLENLADYI